MPSTNRADFGLSTKRTLAERAGYRCSNSACYKLTIGPDSACSTQSLRIGIAAHICAASPQGPRFDPTQSASDRKSIKNGIWLCENCARKIDNNNGISYPPDMLRQWKEDHEKYVSLDIEGKRRLMTQGVDFEQQQIAQNLLDFLSDRRMLFNPMNMERGVHVRLSVEKTRDDLTQFACNIRKGSPLESIVETMRKAYRRYMDTVDDNTPQPQMEQSLWALRCHIGKQIKDIAQYYDVTVPKQLTSLLPK